MTTPIKFLEESKPCSVCGLPTVTKKTGKGMRAPMHVGCDKRQPESLSDVELMDVLTTIADKLGPVRMLTKPPPARPMDVGPCLRCQTPTRRYGDHGSNYCHRCDKRKPKLTQPPLFPITACECGHRFPVMPEWEEGEPCPACLTSADDRHDCPMHVEEEA